MRIQRVRSVGVLADFTPWQRSLGLGWTDLMLIVPGTGGVTRVDYDSGDWAGAQIEFTPSSANEVNECGDASPSPQAFGQNL